MKHKQILTTIFCLLSIGNGLFGGQGAAATEVDFRDYTLEVVSEHGEPHPGVGQHTYAWGATVSASAGSEHGYLCTGWSGSGSVPATGSESSTGSIQLVDLHSWVTWQWAVDTDNDGLEDQWELDHFGDLSTADAASDTDGDGQTDLEEFAAGSNPRAYDLSAEIDLRDYTLELIAAHGTPSPAVGVHTYAWRATVSASAGSEHGYLCTGWSGSGSVPATGSESSTGSIQLVDLNSSITWLWVERDSDNDGLSDLAEEEAGTNPLLADTDGDGLSDGDEVVAGSNPRAYDLNAEIDLRDYTLEVIAAHGTPSPAVGVHTYAWRATVTASAGAGSVDYVFTGWSGTGSVPETGSESSTDAIQLVDLNSSITWLWVERDSDNDGLDDQWEQDYFGGLNTANATTDTDGDGQSDLDEFTAVSNPLAYDFSAPVDFRDYTLEVIAAHGTPSPAVGVHTYAWRTTLTLSAGSLDDFYYLGWSGSGSVPATGSESSTGSIQLVDVDSSITWQWIGWDSDGDGLDYQWEQDHFGDLSSANASTDHDGDGLLDSAEQAAGTNPLLADSDADGLGDKIEVDNLNAGLDPLVDQSALIAAISGAIRQDPQQQQAHALYSEANIRNISVGAPLIQVDREAGQVVLDVEIQWADDLENANWQSLEVLQSTDDQVGDKLFYRVFIHD